MKSVRNESRRRFLRHSTASVAATASTAYFPWSEKAFANQSKNDRPVIGGIGLGGRGLGDCRRHSQFGDIVAVADVDEQHALRAKNDPRVGKGKAETFSDYRKLLDRKDIDVISIATPDHWHVKIAIEALQAGKHVFCQKPLTLTLEENQLIRAACAKHDDRVFMVGTQQRSDRTRFLRAVNMVQKGLLGEITHVKVGINGSSVGKRFEKSDPPSNLNWDAWLGQAPLVDYIKQRCHGSFRWWYEYAGGKFTDWGAHHIDIATWAIDRQGQGQGPVSLDGSDASHPIPFDQGYPTADDTFNTSHDFNIVCKYSDGLQMDIESRGDKGILFTGKKGRIFVNRHKLVGTPIQENWDRDAFGQSDLQRMFKGKVAEGHDANFYRCIREGGLPVSDVFTHVQALNVCHLAAIAARVGRKIQWDPKAEKIVGDETAAGLFARKQRAGYEIPSV